MNKLPAVLLVDDDNVFNTLNRRMLAMVGINEVKVCLNGQQAIDYLLTVANGNVITQKSPISLVLLDINMPVMNGWEFLDEFNKHPSIQSLPVSIVVLTSSKNPDDERMARENPFVADYMVKPMNRTRLKEILSVYCNVSTQD